MLWPQGGASSEKLSVPAKLWKIKGHLYFIIPTSPPFMSNPNPSFFFWPDAGHTVVRIFCRYLWKYLILATGHSTVFWICPAIMHGGSFKAFSPSQHPLPPSVLLSSIMVHADKWVVGWGLTCAGLCLASVSLPKLWLSVGNIGRDSEYFTTLPNLCPSLGPAPLIQPNMLQHDHFSLFIKLNILITRQLQCDQE